METIGDEIDVPISQALPNLRLCFRTPVPEIALAARLLDDAVTAHLLGHSALAEQLIRMADMPEIREWTESVWGKASLYVQHTTILDGPSILGADQRVKIRMPSQGDRRILLQRDGYHCRFCQIPLIRPEVRSLLHTLYPSALVWGSSNVTQHAAFQAMWVQYDHVLPHARGGDNSLDNFLITCAACNFGRMDKTLAEVGLEDPRNREPFRSDWNGLERLMSAPLRSRMLDVREGPVDCSLEHFELRFGSPESGWDDWLPIAIVGLANVGTANVEFLVDRQGKNYLVAAEKVWKEVRFYLTDLDEENPWAYAQHHCGTSANLYSDVHWAFSLGEHTPGAKAPLVRMD